MYADYKAAFHIEKETTTFENLSVNKIVGHMSLVVIGFKCLWIVLGYTGQTLRLMIRGPVLTLIERFLATTWGPSGSDRTQVGHMLAPWTLLSGYVLKTASLSGTRGDTFWGPVYYCQFWTRYFTVSRILCSVCVSVVTRAPFIFDVYSK